jgi:16S rRNA (adenine1518-N6/adenine1519-N6)-dimethyltransferase
VVAQTKQQIQALLATISARPSHRLGQNFMIDGNLLRLVAEAAQITPGELVVEVGPGTGSLTEELLARGASVVAVEIDGLLAALLRERLGDRGGFKLIEGDALSGKHALSAELLAEISAARQAGRKVKLAANLPYHIASPLVIDMLIAGADLLAFTVQKEVAQRLAAGPATEAYGALSVMTQLLARVEILRTLPPQAFWPMPKIDSALVRLTRVNQLGEEAEPFSQFVHSVFSYRRKMLRKALGEAGISAGGAIEAMGLRGKMRPEEVSPEKWLSLFGALGRPRGG